MTVHLIKMAVGVEDVQHLADLQSRRLEQSKKTEKKPELYHFTRHMPRRSEELLEGGSIYWVIKRLIRVRQRILGLKQTNRPDGRPACAIILDSQLVRTEPRRFKAFQGWRYFQSADVPKDSSKDMDAVSEMPSELAEELKDLGLL
ncbi:MAG: DUF1489 domain-containing protein [Rhodospirillales bacterium]|nr:DUF1489 domain-containing protein [Rhodospirillales bacterium]